MKEERSWAQSELMIALKHFPACQAQAKEEEEGFSGEKDATSPARADEGRGLLPVPPDRQCCLSTEEEWPSLLGAAVRTWCSFHGLSHQELQGLRLQDYFVVKLLRYKKIRVWDLYYQRTNAAHHSFDFCQPRPCLHSFACLPYAATVPSTYGVWVCLLGEVERVWQGLKKFLQ